MALPDIIFRDFWWKFLAFVLATLVWVNFGGKLNEHVEVEEGSVGTFSQQDANATVLSKPLTRPITVLRSPTVADVYRLEPAEVSVVVKGEAGKLRTLDTKQILAFVDVTDMNDENSGAASWRRMSRIIKVSLPAGVELVSLVPQSVIVEKILPVEPEVSDTNSN